MEPFPPNLKTLRRLRPLTQFNDDQLLSLAKQLRVATARDKEVLLQLGCMEEFNLFILKGDIVITARDGKSKQVSFTESEELNPVANLRPSLYDVYAASIVEYLKIENKFLTEFANLLVSDTESSSVEVIEHDVEANPLTLHLFQDMMSDNVSLPSLPSVALRIQRVFKDEAANADRIAEVLMTDPAITSKLIKIANSPVYQGVSATETLQGAIVRLGMDATYKHVMAYSVNELFRSKSRKVSERMEELWSHSRKVAAISHVLAKRTGLFDPEHAMLAGLVHDLGVIVIVEYIRMHCDQLSDPVKIEQTIQTLRPQISGMLMQKWNFTEDIVTVSEECEDWFRNKSDQVDLCDLIMVAQCHSMVGSKSIQTIPPIFTIPALSKLGIGLQESVDLIKESNKEINEVERLLH